MKKLELLLINPGSRTQIYQSLGATLAAIEPPVWAGLMATYVRRLGISVQILDAEAEQLTPTQTAERVKDMAPLLAAAVVYGHQPSASTQNMVAAGAVCRAIKEQAPEQKVLMVGGHVAALPERTLREESCDYVCEGEGLSTLAALTQGLKEGQPNLDRVPDLWFWKEKEPTRSEQRAPLLRDLDVTMPGVAWDLLPMEKYRAHNWHCFGHLQRQPYASLYTTLGCPYRCTFCCIQAPFKSGEKEIGYKESVNSYRFWSPKTIVDDIGLLVTRYGVRNIKFADEMFVLNKRHVAEICDLIIARGYDLNIWAYARVDTVKEGLVEKLKRAGFNWLAFGIEAANESVRNEVEKGFDQQDVFTTLEQVRSSGINVIGNYIFGLPEDNRETMQATLDLALDLNCEFANFYSAMAYPGSQLYSQALKNGWRLPDKWSGYSQHSVDTLPLPTKYLTAGEVLRFRDQAFQKYFTSSGYLGLVENKFGIKTAKHIRDMASHTLTRLYA